MTITLKYFGLVADITNLKEEIFVFEGQNISISFLKSNLEQNYPKLIDTTYSVAVNKTIIEDSYMIKDKDIIALLPPFAGG